MSLNIFTRALLKGLIEHMDPARYFGSTGALADHMRRAEACGWIVGREVTDEGRRVYNAENLTFLPHEGRAYMWDWDKPRGTRLPRHRRCHARLGDVAPAAKPAVRRAEGDGVEGVREVRRPRARRHVLRGLRGRQLNETGTEEIGRRGG